MPVSHVSHPIPRSYNLSEVRDLIEKEVEAVMEEDESKIHYVSLINHLIQALGNDASWVELYGVTGELVIPDMPQDSDSDFGGKLLTVKEVSHFSLVCWTSCTNAVYLSRIWHAISTLKFLIVLNGLGERSEYRSTYHRCMCVEFSFQIAFLLFVLLMIIVPL